MVCGRASLLIAANISVLTLSAYIEVPLSKFSCAISPPSYKAPYFRSDGDRQQTKYSTRLGNFTLEFTEDEVMIFSTYLTRKGAPVQYRREYLSFKLAPISETYGAAFQPGFRTYEAPIWDKFVPEGTDRIRINTTSTANLITEYIFEYKENKSPPYVKFSTIVYSS